MNAAVRMGPPAPTQDPRDTARKTWVYGEWRDLNCFADRTPAREMPRLSWVVKILPRLVRVALNDRLVQLARWLGLRQWTRHEVAPRRPVDRPALLGVPEAPDSAARGGRLAKARRRARLSLFTRLDRELGRTLGDDGTASSPSQPISGTTLPPHTHPTATIDDYLAVYAALPEPEAARRFRDSGLTDALFAWLRLAGPSCEVITRTEVPQGFSPDLKTPAGESIRDVAQDRRLFIADYSDLAPLVNSSWHGVPRFVGTPRALFAVEKNGGFVPVAIQCERNGAVFTPTDPPSWALAKHVVQVADGNHHELIDHLGRTHLLVELFLMATRRNLSPAHPLFRLLVPHFEGTVFINTRARGDLIASNGAIDRIFAGTITSSQDVAIRSLTTLDLECYDLPTRTKARETETITVYPFRDDALRIWDAIERFVSGVLRQAYPNVQMLQDDSELTDWSTVLAGPVANGGAPGFAPPRTLQELTRLATLIIYTASAQHAAVNFAQYPLMSFSPLFAGAGWVPPPTPGRPLPPLMDFYPPRELALEQSDTLYLLSSVHHTRLGHYEPGWFEGEVLQGHVTRFQAELAQIEKEITADNAARPQPYRYLLPSLIPQSINI